MISNIFINPVEKRLRAFWRLLAQFVLFFLINTIISIPIGIGAALVMGASGGNLTDPQVIASLMSHPYLRAASGVAGLVAMILSYLIAARWMDRRPLRDFGFHFNRSWWTDLGFGLVLGAILMAFVFAVELAAGWITISGTMQSFRSDTGFWAGIFSYVILFLCVGIYEEMLSRGYQMRNMAEGLNLRAIGPRAALLLAYLFSSSIFGLLHLGNPNADWVSTFNIVIAGLFLGLGFLLTGELAIPIGLHITWNFFQGNVFGFPVSGGESAASFIAVQQGGPDVWTGGAFGPEAGIIGLIAMALGSIATILWVRMRYERAQIQDRLAVYNSPEDHAAQTALQDAGPADLSEA